MYLVSVNALYSPPYIRYIRKEEGGQYGVQDDDFQEFDVDAVRDLCAVTLEGREHPLELGMWLFRKESFDGSQEQHDAAVQAWVGKAKRLFEEHFKGQDYKWSMVVPVVETVCEAGWSLPEALLEDEWCVPMEQIVHCWRRQLQQTLSHLAAKKRVCVVDSQRFSVPWLLTLEEDGGSFMSNDSASASELTEQMLKDPECWMVFLQDTVGRPTRPKGGGVVLSASQQACIALQQMWDDCDDRGDEDEDDQGAWWANSNVESDPNVTTAEPEEEEELGDVSMPAVAPSKHNAPPEKRKAGEARGGEAAKKRRVEQDYAPDEGLDTRLFEYLLWAFFGKPENCGKEICAYHLWLGFNRSYCKGSYTVFLAFLNDITNNLHIQVWGGVKLTSAVVKGSEKSVLEFFKQHKSVLLVPDAGLEELLSAASYHLVQLPGGDARLLCESPVSLQAPDLSGMNMESILFAICSLEEPKQMYLQKMIEGMRNNLHT
jgi:hypothetical protein